MCETIYIEKNKTNRFSVHFYNDSSDWKLFLDVCGVKDDKLAVIYSSEIANEAWKAYVHNFAAEDSLCLNNKNDNNDLKAFIKDKIAEYTFVVLAEPFIMDLLYEVMAQEYAKMSFVCVPVTPAAHFCGVSVRPKFDKTGEMICKEVFPQAVYADVSVLKDATPLAFQEGVAAAFRLAIANKASMFEWMISNMYELTDAEPEAIEEFLQRGYLVQKERIEKDTAKERALPLFGAEFLNVYKNAIDGITESDALALSIVSQACLSWKKELLSMDEFYEIRDMLVFFGLPITETEFATEDFMAYLDTKNPWSETDEFVYIRKVGKIVVDEKPSVELLKDAFSQIYYDEEANE